MRQRNRQRTLLRRVLVVITITCALVGWLGGASPASAQQVDLDQLEPCPEDRDDITAVSSEIRIVKIAGLIDPVVREAFDEGLDRGRGLEPGERGAETVVDAVAEREGSG